MIVHPQSFRALAYEVQNHLLASSQTDDSRIRLPLIEQELRHQYGDYLKKADLQLAKIAGEPDPSRLQTSVVSLPTATGYEAIRSVDIVGVYNYNGSPYTQYVGTDDVQQPRAFVPVKYSWQLQATMQVTGQACFCFSGHSLVLYLLPELTAVERIRMVAIPTDPFPAAGRGDEWFWKQAWFCSEEIKEKIKIQTIRVFMNTHIQLLPRSDTKNNGTDQ